MTPAELRDANKMLLEQWDNHLLALRKSLNEAEYYRGRVFGELRELEAQIAREKGI